MWGIKHRPGRAKPEPRGGGAGGAEHLHEPACCLCAAGPRACWGDTEVIQHEVVSPPGPKKPVSQKLDLGTPPPGLDKITPSLAPPLEPAKLRPEH